MRWIVLSWVQLAAITYCPSSVAGKRRRLACAVLMCGPQRPLTGAGDCGGELPAARRVRSAAGGRPERAQGLKCSPSPGHCSRSSHGWAACKQLLLLCTSLGACDSLHARAQRPLYAGGCAGANGLTATLAGACAQERNKHRPPGATRCLFCIHVLFNLAGGAALPPSCLLPVCSVVALHLSARASMFTVLSALCKP